MLLVLDQRLLFLKATVAAWKCANVSADVELLSILPPGMIAVDVAEEFDVGDLLIIHLVDFIVDGGLPPRLQSR